MIELKQFELPPIGTNAYLLIDQARQEAILFDAPLNAWASVEKVLVEQGLTLVAVLFTHGHWDHLLDGHYFSERQIPVYGHNKDQLFFDDPNTMANFAIPGLEMKPCRLNHLVEDGEKLTLMGLSAEVRHVPGHSPGSVLFWIESEGLAITGDAIFKGSIGRTDFPGCSFDVLEESIRSKIYTLPNETRLLPGHGPETTVEFEKQNNPYVRSN